MDTTTQNQIPSSVPTNTTPNTLPTGIAPTVINGPFPEELHHFNWGAFLLSWIWGIAHSVWFSLLIFVPIVNIVVPFVLGFKGNEWAWQHRKFSDINQFKQVQKAWATWGIILTGIVIILAFISFNIIATWMNATLYDDYSMPNNDSVLRQDYDPDSSTNVPVPGEINNMPVNAEPTPVLNN